MKQRTHHRLFAGTVLGATLALAAVAGAAATGSGEGHGEMMENGMMEGGMMGSMHKMMSQCNDMMASMQEKHDMQSGDEQSTDDAS